MFERRRPADEGVFVELDGERLPARRGEPLAAALLAAGEIRLARSPKLHRPRGPSCLRGDCDGCLMRVDGRPNVTTCLRAVRGGEVVRTQNVLGTRRVDLLRVTDWFFPEGIDHHHLLAGVPGVSGVMTSFARKMAGLGRLPEGAPTPAAARHVGCDVLVVGGGRAGLRAAAALAGRGLEVKLVDEGVELGGDLLSRGEEGARELSGLDLSDVDVLAPATAIGVYGGEVVVVPVGGGSVVVSPRALVVATGAHDGVLAVPNNDLPGVLSARALLRLGRLGVALRERAALVGDGAHASAAAALLGPLLAARLAPGDVAEIEGGSAVRGVRTVDGTKIGCSAVVTDLPPAPAFELAEQAGARARLGAAGFGVETDAAGRAARACWAVGGCTGRAWGDAEVHAVVEDVARTIR